MHPFIYVWTVYFTDHESASSWWYEIITNQTTTMPKRIQNTKIAFPEPNNTEPVAAEEDAP